MNNVASNDAADTQALGAKLAAALSDVQTRQAIVITLNGELGAGKTTFVAGFLRALGVAGSVKSPTYTLIEHYELQNRTVYHLDLYRLAAARDLEMLALRDLLHEGSVLLVEWAEKGASALPSPDLSLTMRYPADASNSSARLIEITGYSTAGKELAARLRE